VSDDFPVIPPPSSATVDMERKPLLYLPDGRVLVQRIGFNTQPRPKR
jgi:hypothetical protein